MGDTTKYVYTGSALLFTTDENNDRITNNILTPGGQIIASERYSYNAGAMEWLSEGFYFYNFDIRQSTTSIINKNFVLKKDYFYDAYGNTSAGSQTFNNDVEFTGAVADTSGLHYMNARFYDSNSGRFLTQDTYTGNAWDPMSQNLYSYVGNNPTNYTDPTGHYPAPLQMIDGYYLSSGHTDYIVISPARKLLRAAKEELEKAHTNGDSEGRMENDGDNNTIYNEWYDEDDNNNYPGYWLGKPWCAMFVAYCAEQAGILYEVVFKQAGVANLAYDYTLDGKRFKRSSNSLTKGYLPKEGDLIFYRKQKKDRNGELVYDKNGNPEYNHHVGIVEAYDSKTGDIYTIEGNLNNGVNRAVRNITDTYVWGFGSNGGVNYGLIPSYDFPPAENSSSTR